MTKIIVIILLVCCTPWIIGLKKAPKFILDRMNIIIQDESASTASGRISKINRTSFAVNVNISVFKDLNPLFFDISVYALYSNEYRLMPLSIKRNFCDILDMEFKWIEKDIRKYSKLPETCHVKKGEYYVKDYVPDTTRFPFISPWENVKIRAKISYGKNKKDAAIIDVMAHIKK